MVRIISILIVTACSPAPREPTAARPDPVDPGCAWPSEPEVVARDGTAVLEVWEIPASPVLEQLVIPDDPGLLAYRRAIREAGADRRRPVADPPEIRDAAERELWRREDRNAELVHSGQVGRLRPIHCLEALLFAHQNRRHDQLARPTELIASILRKGNRLRVLFAGGAEMFPPKSVYGFDRVQRAVAAGWQLRAILHNHTIQRYRGRPALGQPVPSTGDVQLLRSLAVELGMFEARVTNGLYTGVVETAELERLESRD